MNNLFLIVSDNLELTNYYLHDILSKITYEDSNKIIYDLNINSLSDILDEASMISLFDGNKVIIGEDFDLTKLSSNDLDYLQKYIQDINKTVYIILITSKVDARKATYKIFKDNFKIINATNDNVSDIFKYVSNLVKEKGYKMNDGAINHFITKVGNNINNINNELDKLFIYKMDNKVIDITDINLLVIDNIDTVIYEFTNAILEDDLDTVVKMYHNFKLQNISFDYLIASIANTFRQALIIKMLYNDKKSNLKIAKIIGKKEFYVKKMLERIYKYTEDDLADYIKQLAAIDYNFKTGQDNYDALELFLIKKS